jgi:hypothetical protein
MTAALGALVALGTKVPVPMNDDGTLSLKKARVRCPAPDPAWYS